MGTYSKFASALALSAAMTGAPVFAQSSAPEAPAPAQTIQPMTEADAQVAFNKAIDLLKKQVEQAKSLSTDEKKKLAAKIEAAADDINGKLETVIREASRLSGDSFLAGIVVTIAGEVTIAPFKHFGGGVAYEPFGFALFLKNGGTGLRKNLRAARANNVGGGIEAMTETNATQNKSGFEYGVRVKLLFSNAKEDNPILSIDEFSGAYTGTGPEFRFGGMTLGGRWYTKPQTCIPFRNCRIHVFGVNVQKATNAAPLSWALAEEIYLDFPSSNAGRGNSL